MIKGLEKWGDKVIPCELGNGNIAYYVNMAGTDIEVGIWIKDENKLEVFNQVDEKLISVILQYRGSNERLRFWYGDRDTGKSWNEEYDVMGTIGRTGGDFKIPILLNNSRSYGGGAILIGSLVRIDEISSHRTLWKVPNFHVEDMKVYECFGDENYKYRVAKLSEASGEWEVEASFKTEKQAHNWVAFMRGKRYSK